MLKSVSTYKKLCLYLLILLVSVSGSNALIAPAGIKLSSLLAMLYIALCFIDGGGNVIFNRKQIVLNVSLIFLFFYLFFYSLLYFSVKGGVIYYGYFAEILIGIFVFIFIVEDVHKNPNILYYMHILFIFSMLTASILIYFGIGLEVGRTDGEFIAGETRLYFFGMNPNELGQNATLAIILLIGLFSRLIDGNKLLFIVLTFLSPLLLLPLLLAASKGALVVLSVCLILYFTLNFKNVIVWFISLAISFSVSITIFFVYIKDSLLYERLVASDGDLSTGRLDIWIDAFEIFTYYPLFGISDPGYRVEMLRRFSYYMDTHNLFLLFLVKGGLICFGIFLFLFYKMFKSSISYYLNKRDALPLTLFLAMFIISLKSGGIITSPYLWAFYAYIVSYGYMNKSKCSKNIVYR